MAIPDTWRTVDPSVWIADETLSSVALKRTRQNNRYLHKEITRCCSVGYGVANRPLMCGAIIPGVSNFDYVAIPYLWDPVDATSIIVRVSALLVIPSGTGSFKLNVFWQELASFVGTPVKTRKVQTDAAFGATEVTLSTAGNSIESFTLDLSNRVDRGEIVIWVQGQSSVVSTPSTKGTGAISKIRTRSVEVDDPTAVADTMRPTLVVDLDDNPLTGGSRDILASRRQVIRLEQNATDGGEEIVYVWPPYRSQDWNGGLASALAAGTPRILLTSLTSIKIAGVSIEDITSPLPDYEASMDAGVAPSARVGQNLYTTPANLFLKRTRVLAIGTSPDVSLVDDYDSVTPTQRSFRSVKLTATSTWYGLGGCYLRQRDVFRSTSDTADKTRSRVRVRALVALDLLPRAFRVKDKVPLDEWDSGVEGIDVLQFKLTMASETGATLVNSVAYSVVIPPTGYNSSLDATTPLNLTAPLLDLQRATPDSIVGWQGAVGKTHAHTLSDAFPLSAWADSRVALVDVGITDTQTVARVLNLEVATAVAGITSNKAIRVHVLSWLVTVSEETESSVEGV